MKDFEKDKFIKDIFQKDKTISKKAEDIFKNIDYTKKETPEYIDPKPKKEFPKVTFWLSGFLTVAASFVVVAVSAGTAIYVNRDKINGDATPITTQSSRTAINGKIVKTGTGEEITIKNEEVKPEDIKEKNIQNNNSNNESYIINEQEDEYIKVVVMNDNRVLIKLKDEYLRKMNWEGSLDNYIEIEGINKQVYDIFIDKGNAVLLLMEDGTVEYAKILNKQDSDFKEIYFFDNGQIEGLTNISRFEQKEEKIWNSDEKYYYVIAISVDDKEKEISYTEYNDMEQEYEEKSFTSQDIEQGEEKVYEIKADKHESYNVHNWVETENGVYYKKDSNLYYMSFIDGYTTRIATGIESVFEDETGDITARSKKDGFILHEMDTGIKIWDYDVRLSAIVEKQENEYIILTRKLDNSLNLEFKPGAIKELFENNPDYKIDKGSNSNEVKYLENYVYNFYITENTIQNPLGEVYADASIMHLGTSGIDSKMCIVYASSDGKLCEVDLYEYMMNDKTGRFHINNDYNWKQYDEEVQEIKTVKCDVEYENGTTGICDVQEYVIKGGEGFYNLIRTPQDETFGIVKYPDGNDVQLRY